MLNKVSRKDVFSVFTERVLRCVYQREYTVHAQRGYNKSKKIAHKRRRRLFFRFLNLKFFALFSAKRTFETLNHKLEELAKSIKYVISGRVILAIFANNSWGKIETVD